MGEGKSEALAALPAMAEPGREAEFLDMLLRHLDVGVSILDSDLRYRLISATAFNTMGLSEGDLKLGDSLSDCHALMRQKGLLTDAMIKDLGLSAAKQREHNHRGEDTKTGIMTLGDGTTHRHIRKSLDNGYTLSLATDVSDIVEKDRLLEGALALGNAGYWIYEFATKTYQLSDSFQNYLGPEAVERVHAEGVIACVYPEDRPHFKQGLKSLTQGETRFEVECRTLSRLGNERWSRTTAELVRDPNGRPLRLRAFVRDVTSIRRKAAELERAKDEAIAASQAKSEFLANMSHEIRTPMNGVLGMAELLAASVTDERQREYVDVINSSANALLNIINDILDFSKIEAGALEIDPMPFDLRSCIADVSALLVATAQEKGLELIIDYPEDLPRHFIGDARRVRQVLTNLVGNAIKFTESGYVKTQVGIRCKGDLAVISLKIVDTGIGIPPTKIGRVFDKFTQADGSTTRVYGGTGLGLTITKRIVEMMSGRISVKSDLGKGSTFAVRIPLPIDKTARVEKFDTGVLRSRRALVVDDIDVNCNVLRRQLANWNMSVDCAHNGIEAIEALQHAYDTGRPYDLVLLDYLMPGVNGRELAAMMARRDGLEVPPTIMLSSCDQPISSQELAEIGIESYLVKPVRERRLYDTVVRVLSNRPDATSAATQPKPLPPLNPEPSEEDPTDASLSTAAKTAKTEILVAEDFALNRDVVRLMLSGSNYEPVFAENGEAAVALFTAEPDRFPIVLMDVSMPVMDGYMATQEIRAWEAKQSRDAVPIIALTGHALKTDRQECINAGMDDYLTKPVKQQRLLEKLEHFAGHVVQASNAA